MEHAEALPEATPICPGTLLQFGSRTAINQALSRLARSGDLMRICHGVYMRRVPTRFGMRGPSISKALANLSKMWGETWAPAGAAAANCLGLMTQNPMRSIYLSTGPDRWLHFGRIKVELRHAPRWQLTAPYRKAGELIRALAWLGPREVEDSLETVLPTLSEEDLAELSAARAVLPSWIAAPLSAKLAHA